MSFHLPLNSNPRPTWRHLVLSAAILAAPGPCTARADTGVHLTYHWHLHQPIYWPELHPTLARYQFAAESLDVKVGGGNTYPGSPDAHPRNNLAGSDGEFDEVFSKADRVNAYQYGGLNSINTITGHPDAGASVSYSGSLMENIWSFGMDLRLGYGPDWNSGYTQARQATTSAGTPRGDMLGMTYHHSFSPLLPRSVLRKEIEIFKEVWWKSWSGAANGSDHSKGFWPIECAFSSHMIPVLVEQGYEWVIVANSHLARTCGNYLDVANKGTGGWNMDPPNAADRLGPTVPAGQWYSASRDARGGTFPAPFAYQTHKAKHVDPETGAETKITIVPMCDYLSYENGFGSMGTGVIDAEIAPFNDPAKPSIVLMAHDGDNAWGGGNSYYQESVPNLMNAADSAGYRPTTIQTFLDTHPVAATDVVHVEDGAWVNPADDWGHPQYINWLWPPVRSSSDPAYDGADPRTWYDFENGWAEDWRNWAVIIAAANHCETAEQMATGNGRAVQAARIQEPVQPGGMSNSPNHAERAWHHLLGALDSGFMYFGTSLDDEVKQTLGGNLAIGFAAQAMADNPGGVPDQTPPTVFKPQRFPWNPGGMGWGPLTGYRAVGFEGKAPHYSDFHIWTHVYDVSGLSNVTLYVREDGDGVNPIGDNANETYAGGAGVGPWTAIPMNQRIIDPLQGNGGNINFFLLPTHIADQYWVEVTGYDEVLLDYYVAAVDILNNTNKSEIQHVYVGAQNLSGGSGGGPVTFTPSAPLDCDDLTVTYDSAGRVLSNAVSVTMTLWFDPVGTTQDVVMSTSDSGATWSATASIPTNTTGAGAFFHDGASTTDDNGGADWTLGISSCETGPSSVTFAPPLPNGCGDVTITYQPAGGPLKDTHPVHIHVGRNNWNDTLQPDPAMAENPDGSWSYTYSLLPGTLEINCAFNNGGGLWDNNAGTDWTVTVMNCTIAPPPPQTACLVSGSPAVSGDAPGQNFSTDAFDLDTSGGPVATSVLSGFGTFGNVYLNYDESNLYIGAEATDVEADNNAAILFVGVDTLTHDATHLRDKSGNPRALDVLDNLDLITPMDIAILIGDEYGDGTFPVFNLGSGGSFGQGIFALAAGTFPEVAGAALSQFDGAGSTPTGDTDADGNRITDRWEARIPWSSLAATGVTGLASVHLAGIIASTGENGGNRYLSGNVLGAAMTPSGMDGGNVGFNDMDLTGFEVCLPVPDTDGDGLPDLWETQYYGGPTAAVAGSDDDGDGFTALQEFWLGTHPTNAASSLKITTVSRNGSATWLTFKTIGDKAYDIEFSDDLTGPGGGFLLATQVTEMDVAAGNEAQESFVDDFLATGGPPTNDIRHYRINFPVP